VLGARCHKCQVRCQVPECQVRCKVLLALDGLHPPSMGARVTFTGGKVSVTDGPFTESKAVVGGYWLIQVKSKEEAIEWASRCPVSHDGVIEIRQVQEFSDFPPDVREAAARLPEMQGRSGERAGGHTR
jgi:hypothetical protein